MIFVYIYSKAAKSESADISEPYTTSNRGNYNSTVSIEKWQTSQEGKVFS